MVVDKDYCSSSFLMLRTIFDTSKCFSKKFFPFHVEENKDRKVINDSFELEAILKDEMRKICSTKKVALALSGGIDSAILARFMPKGSVAYTFKCVVPGLKVTDETDAAKVYAEKCGLEHRIIEIYWSDFEKFSSELMIHKGAPIHSIEVQIYKAALKAKEDGFDCLVFGESADVNFGGQDGLLSKDWTTEQYLNRYSYVMPSLALKKYHILKEPFEKFSQNGFINAHEFNRHVYYVESINSYYNAICTAGIDLCMPFSKTFLGPDLDLNRIRNGENKYLVREIFLRLYPDLQIPKKTPMPRPMNEWLEKWSGPIRDEFYENCASNLNGDQKWLLWALERFLNIIED